MYRRAIDLMEAELGDELVALDPKAGECFGFNGVATSVWRILEEPRSFEQLRVRHYGDVARVELDPGALMTAIERRAEVVAAVKASGYRYVTLDLEGFRSGNLNAAL